MPKLIYKPRALDDLQGIKTYISRQFGADRAKICGFPSDIIWNPAGLTSRTGSIPVAGMIFERNTAYSENVVVLFL